MRALLTVLVVAITHVGCGETDSSSADVTASNGGASSGGSRATGGAADHLASGDAVPAGGTSGAGGTAGTGGHQSEEAGPGAADSGDVPDASLAPDGAASVSYSCSLILGILTTSEWFGGFEKVVDDARWELKFQDSAHLEKWADPENAVWSLPVTSPCAEHASAPERVVFMGTNYDYDTVEQFLPRYVAVWNNVRAKYPSVVRMDVMTYTRGPGNLECVDADRPNDSYIKPAQDEAIAEFVGKFPGAVFATPRWEVASCSDFTLCPHLTGPANAVIAKTIGAYFRTH